MRSLADDLRQRSDVELAALLRARIDLLHPTPTDLAALAQRAGSTVSVNRALDHLDRFTLQVVESMAALAEPSSRDQVLATFPADLHEPVGHALDLLRGQALIWGGSSDRLVRAVRDAMGPHPGGLGPWGADRFPEMSHWDRAQVSDLIADAPEAVSDLLNQLMWGPPTGAVSNADRHVTIESARTPIEWLLARKLLLPQAGNTVFLPREVGLALREITVGYPAVIRCPAWPPAEPIAQEVIDTKRVDHAAAEQGYGLVASCMDLLDAWSTAPPPVLRKGGIAQRDLTGASRILDSSEEVAAFVVELVLAAGLLGRDGTTRESWRPTTDFDPWRADNAGSRWVDLVRTWWGTTRAPHLIRRSEVGNEPINALSDQARFAALPSLRSTVGELMEGAAPGSVIGAGEVLRCLDDRHPRLSNPAHDNAVRAIVTEAELLGVTGHFALSSMGRLLVSGASDAELMAAFAAHLPTPVDQVLVQGDMTAVAPGPLTPEAAHELRLLADIESTGGATVYRFSTDSLSRGFEAGYDADEIERILRSRSMTPLPQALTYLIHDVQRTHGRVRVGLASSYIRCDDPTVLARALADPRAVQLGLTRAGEDIIMATAPTLDVLRFLHSLGLSAIAETPDGQPVSNQELPERSPATRGMGDIAEVTTRSAHTDDVIKAVVQSLLRQHSAGTVSDLGKSDETHNDDLPETSTTATVALIRQSIEDKSPLTVGYVDEMGSRHGYCLTPLRVFAGTVTAIDHANKQVRDFALARFTGARVVAQVPSRAERMRSTS